MGLWDAIVPGTFNGIVEDAGPGATEAGIQDWLEGAIGTLPDPLNFISDWFLRAWADDLDFWPTCSTSPSTARRSSVTCRSRRRGPMPATGPPVQVMLMMGLFDGLIELQYFGALTLAKLAFYCDFRANTAGTPPVGGPYIGFPALWAPRATTTSPTTGQPAPRQSPGRHADGLVAVP